MKQVTLSLVAAAALTFVGCDGRTAKPLCADQSGPIEGISGVYDLNLRNQETFGIDVVKLRAIPDGKGAVQVTSVDSKEDLHIEICNVNGTYILEVEDRDLNAFASGRIYVSQVGLHISELMFDKVALDAAGIPNKLIAFPESVRKILGSSISNKLELGLQSLLEDSDMKAIYVNNTDVPASKLLQFAKPSSFGFTWFRE